MGSFLGLGVFSDEDVVLGVIDVSFGMTGLSTSASACARSSFGFLFLWVGSEGLDGYGFEGEDVEEGIVVVGVS